MRNDKSEVEKDGRNLYHVEVRRVFGGPWERVGSNISKNRADRYVAEHDEATPGEFRIVASDDE